MFKKIAAVIVVLVGALLDLAATRPDSLHVQRMATIKAPPDRIFPLVKIAEGPPHEQAAAPRLGP
jgi:hypothetical protein